jgi:FMN-dependent oxidoreductase (nitrilotriacetate monooxygenase family)
VIHLNVLTQATPAPLFEGLWRHPDDRSATGYRSLEYWTWMARRLEAACVDALFFADIHGIYGVYQGSWAPAVRHAMQVPAIDPVLVLPALAMATERLGLAVTYSTSYHQPYQCARTFSTLDHLTAGRVGWNIVTSDSRLAAGTGLGDQVPHDERYDRAEEFLDVVLGLWERSWEDGAVRRNAAADEFTDAGRVHEIAADGKWYQVRGPHQCEPSPQRTPVLYQAGASPRGTSFAARRAEVVFVTLSGPRRGAEQVRALRAKAAEAGRDPAQLKVLVGLPVIVAPTEDEAKAKADLFVDLTSREGKLAKWCGWVGVDLAAYPGDAPVSDIMTNDGRSVLSYLQQAAPDRVWTVADVREFVATPRRPHRFDRTALCGTPGQVADRMQEWLDGTGVDGFNLFPCPSTAGVDDICDLLIPELQRRGLSRTAYDPAETTLRERYFGAGNRRYAVRF